jgi:hypothetical protein
MHISKVKGSGAGVVFLTECYLVLPALLWLCAWLQLWYAVPIVLGIFYALYRHYVALRSSAGDVHDITWISGLVYCGISFLAVFLCGFDGRVMQSWDLIVRNPIYSELITNEWPLVMPDGRMVMYALMFWLPPALISKWLPGMEAMFLQLWCFIGCMLMLLNLHGTLGLRKTILFAIVIGVFTPLSGLVDDVLNVVFHKDAMMGVHFRIPSAGTQWTNTFHYFIVGGLYLTLVTERRLPLGVYVMVSALFACLHPILASVVLPLVVYQAVLMIGGWRRIWRVAMLPEALIGGVLVLTCMLYYASGGSCWWAFTLNAPYAPQNAPWLVYVLGIILAVVPPVLVWWSTRRRIVLLWAALCPVIISCWYGETNGVNEWMYKFTVLYSFYVVYYLVRYIEVRRVRCVLGCLLLCSVLPFLRMVDHSGIIDSARRGFPVQECHFMNQWHGTLYHPGHELYFKLTSEKRPTQWLFR